MHSPSNTPPRQGSGNSDQFSIATRTVTTILPLAGNLNDTSYLLPSTQFHLDISQAQQTIESVGSLAGADQSQQRLTHHAVGSIEQLSDPIGTSTTSGSAIEVSKSRATLISECSENSSNPQDDVSKGKKRNKIGKKSGKLDARSKLEKSRQSARECRARKKLRYQYLEDLVCNREKAVVKLREELNMFCELSKRIESGSVSDFDRKLLLDQNIDNSKG